MLKSVSHPVKVRTATVKQVGPCMACKLRTGDKPHDKEDEVWLIEINHLFIKLCNAHRMLLRNVLSESRHR